MLIKKNIKTIGIYTNQTRSQAQQIRKDLGAWLAQRKAQVFDLSDVSSEKKLQETDLIISLGGDGTILRLAAKVVDSGIPVLGVNAGSLGFITEVRAEELYDELEGVLS